MRITGPRTTILKKLTRLEARLRLQARLEKLQKRQEFAENAVKNLGINEDEPLVGPRE